jgi:hypothetical protein
MEVAALRFAMNGGHFQALCRGSDSTITRLGFKSTVSIMTAIIRQTIADGRQAKKTTRTAEARK